MNQQDRGYGMAKPRLTKWKERTLKTLLLSKNLKCRPGPVRTKLEHRPVCVNNKLGGLMLVSGLFNASLQRIWSPSTDTFYTSNNSRAPTEWIWGNIRVSDPNIFVNTKDWVLRFMKIFRWTKAFGRVLGSGFTGPIHLRSWTSKTWRCCPTPATSGV